MKIAHRVKCKYCDIVFDRDKEEYAVVGGRRYAHAACALREAEKTSSEPPEIINPLDDIICSLCKKPMNRKDADCVVISEGKYAHKKCVELEDKRELTDKEKLDRYIMKLFGTEYVHQRVRRQINTFISDYNYSYSGIQKALIYFYEIKGNSLDRANGGIGIVPYIYQDAYNYYYALWEAGQKNQDKNIADYVPKEKVITISPPQRKIRKRKLFTFLDEEEMDE